MSGDAWLKRWTDWLPEDVDPRPWGDRCGYVPRTDPWSSVDAMMLRVGPRFSPIGPWAWLPPELLAAYFRRTPEQVREAIAAMGLPRFDAMRVTAARDGKREHGQDPILDALGFPREGVNQAALAAQLATIVSGVTPRHLLDAERRVRRFAVFAREHSPTAGIVCSPLFVWRMLIDYWSRYRKPSQERLCAAEVAPGQPCGRPMGERRGWRCMRCYQRQRRAAL